MTIIIASLIIILGFVTFVFTAGNIILTILFAIPLTKKLESKSLIRQNHIINSYMIALLIQITILSITTMIFYMFFIDSYFISLMIGYIIGIFSLLLNIKKFSMNEGTFSEYYEKNKIDFWEEMIAQCDGDKRKLYIVIKSIIDKKSAEN